MKEQPEKLELRSHDIAADKRDELLRLFPEIRIEGGKIDFERLKLALGEAIEVGRERYGLNWPGKADCFKTIQAPSLGTLRPCPEESVNFDSTENLIIEGDNLEVLKLLQKSYLGKVKLIYIDPPYNTGNDFIYPDDYTESLQTYLEYTGQVDAEGRRFGSNTDADGRFHSKWLNMLYPRLYLARNLLRNEGLLFVSCDDNEVHNLRVLMNEVFGEENFLAQVTWKKVYGGGAKVKHVVGLHEYVLCFARDKATIDFISLPPDPKVLRLYKFRDDKYETRGPYYTQPLATTSMDERENLRYAIPYKGQEIWPEKQWQWKKERTMQALENDELVIKNTDKGWSVRYKQYLRDEDGVERGTKPFSILDGPFTQEGTAEIEKLFGNNKVFPFPKPVELIKHFLKYHWQDSDAIVLDFFAGSCTTPQAVLEMNRELGGNRRFIAVQLPEPIDSKDFPTIADVGKERVRRVIKKMKEDVNDKLDFPDGEKPEDLGFRVFKLASSNFAIWDTQVAHEPEAVAKQLELHVDHIRDGRTSDDILYELLLKSGFPLTTPVEKQSLAGTTIYSVAGGALIVCLEDNLTLDLIRGIAERKPERVVLLDHGFAGNDQLKTNAVQTFKTKGVVKFQTV